MFYIWYSLSMKKEITICVLCGVTIITPMLPHNCERKIDLAQSISIESKADFCLDIDAKHDHLPEQTYPIQGDTGVSVTASGTAGGTGVSAPSPSPADEEIVS